LTVELPGLATILEESGFRTGAFIAAYPLEGQFGFSRGFERFDDDLASTIEAPTYYAERPADAVVDVTLAWIRDLPRADRWFAWAHFFDPHHPRKFPEPLGRLPGIEDYDREIRSLDLEIGRLLREIEAIEGRLPVLAIASDHGEALGQHGESSHGLLLYEETMRALFAVDAPSIRGSIHRGIVRHSDFLPTLLDVLELDVPEHVEGRSLLREPQEMVGAYGEAYSPAFNYGWSPLLSWRDDRWTYIEGPDPELYDRETDPAEERNVLDEHPDVGAGFARRIANIAADPEDPAVDALDEESRAKLMALGYLGASGGTTYDSEKDPKKLVHSATALFRGITLFLNEGNAQAALPYLQRAYRADPDNTMAVYYVAFCLNRLGDVPTAMAYYRRTIELNPRAAEAWAHLATLEFDCGRRSVAFDLLEKGLSFSPRAFALLMTAGDLRADVAEPAVADSLYRAAARVEPSRVEPWAKRAELAEARGDEKAARKLWTEAAQRDGGHRLLPAHVVDGDGQ
jgi:tetratricopeptide (TPR) repeat protein